MKKLFVAYVEAESAHISQHETRDAAEIAIAKWCNLSAGSTIYGTPREIIAKFFGNGDMDRWAIYEYDLVATSTMPNEPDSPNLRFSFDGAATTTPPYGSVDHPWLHGSDE